MAYVVGLRRWRWLLAQARTRRRLRLDHLGHRLEELSSFFALIVLVIILVLPVLLAVLLRLIPIFVGAVWVRRWVKWRLPSLLK